MKRIRPLTRPNMPPAIIYQGVFLDLIEKQLHNAMAALGAKKTQQEQ